MLVAVQRENDVPSLTTTSIKGVWTVSLTEIHRDATHFATDCPAPRLAAMTATRPRLVCV